MIGITKIIVTKTLDYATTHNKLLMIKENQKTKGVERGRYRQLEITTGR